VNNIKAIFVWPEGTNLGTLLGTEIKNILEQTARELVGGKAAPDVQYELKGEKIEATFKIGTETDLVSQTEMRSLFYDCSERLAKAAGRRALADATFVDAKGVTHNVPIRTPAPTST
jgi:hypothetical protein